MSLFKAGNAPNANFDIQRSLFQHQFFPELAWAAMFYIMENPIEIGYAVEAAGEAYFRYAPVGDCHKLFSRINPFFLYKPDKCHS